MDGGYHITESPILEVGFFSHVNRLGFKFHDGFPIGELKGFLGKEGVKKNKIPSSPILKINVLVVDPYVFLSGLNIGLHVNYRPLWCMSNLSP